MWVATASQLASEAVAHHGTDWPAWITAIATAVLAGAAILALAGLRDARRTRHAELVTDLSRRWDEPLAVESRELDGQYDVAALLALIERVYDPPALFDTALRDADAATFAKLRASLNLMETIGVLHRERAISTRVVFRMWGASIAETWAKWKEPVALMCDREEHPGVYEHLQRCARRMGKRLAKEQKQQLRKNPSAVTAEGAPARESRAAEEQSAGTTE